MLYFLLNNSANLSDSSLALNPFSIILPSASNKKVVGYAAAQEKQDFKPNIFGFMQFEYRYDDSDSLVSGNTFATRRIWFGVQGSVSELISYNFLGALGSDTFLLNAFVDLKFHPLATVRAGQWQLNFTYEGWQPSNTLSFITRSNVIQHIAANYGTEGRTCSS